MTTVIAMCVLLCTPSDIHVCMCMYVAVHVQGQVEVYTHHVKYTWRRQLKMERLSSQIETHKDIYLHIHWNYLDMMLC